MPDLSVAATEITTPQSLDAYMKALQQMIPSLPAGASVFVIGITLPQATEAPTTSSAPILLGAGGDAVRTAEPLSAEADVMHAETASPIDRTPLEKIRIERRERPNRLRKTAEWASLLGMSARALRRAVEAGALAHEAKPDGRDHGAIVIRPEVLEAFLATEEAVRRGQCARPDWWDDVFGKKAWAHSA